MLSASPQIPCAPSSRHHEPKPDAHQVETLELYSGDEDDSEEEDGGSGPHSGVHSANRASALEGDSSPEMRCPAPVPLAELVSSDEEEEQEMPPPTRVPVRQRVEDVHAPVREPSHAAGGAAAPPSPPVDRWEDSDDEAAGDSHALDEPMRTADCDDTEAVEGEDNWDAEDIKPQAEVPPPRLMSAPGITADENFADDDWDDDDE